MYWRRTRGSIQTHRALSTFAAAAAAPLAGTALTFTPGTALAGGVVLGVATLANLLLNGRVTGISGAVK